MSCTKGDFLRIFNDSNVKNLQSDVDKNTRAGSNYTPNIDFLNNIWNNYKINGCSSFDNNLINFKNQLKKYEKNTPIYKLQLEQIDFLDRLKFTCDCSKATSNIKKTKFIKQVDFDTSSIPAGGAVREFKIKGDSGAVFSMYISNEDSPKKYYNFETKNFTTSKYVLEDVVIKEHSQSVFVHFPKVTDNDHYDITIFANPEFNTKHVDYKEVRHSDTNKTIDVNSSLGSDSAILNKKLYQYTDNTITLTAISPNSITALTGYSITTDTFTTQKYGGKVKFPFTVTLTAATTKAYRILKQPTESEMGSYVERTIGSAALPIFGEDISSSTYYRWPLDNVIGVRNGMIISGSNVTANSVISDYHTSTELSTSKSEELTLMKTGMNESAGIKELQKSQSILKGESKLVSKYGTETIIEPDKRPLKKRTRPTYFKENIVPGVKKTGNPVITNDVITSQAGNIVLNKQQADALKDDTIKILGSGASEIKSLTGYEFKVSNLKAELTKPTTTTTAASTGTNITVADREGVINNVSRLSGIGIDSSTGGPLISLGGGSDGAGTWGVGASQVLESGITLTVEGTGRVVTITGDIEFSKIGESDVTIYFNIENFLAAS